MFKSCFPLGGLASYVHLSAIWGNLSITHLVRIGVSVFTSYPLAKLFPWQEPGLLDDATEPKMKHNSVGGLFMRRSELGP